MGSGYTVEGQKTGEEKFGGLQLEIVPKYDTYLNGVSFSLGKDKVAKPVLFDQTPADLNLREGDEITLTSYTGHSPSTENVRGSPRCGHGRAAPNR